MKRLTSTDQSGQKIINLGAPSASTDAATMGYADSAAAKGRAVVKTVGPSGSSADYVCDGTADNVEIQSAIDAVAAAGGGVVSVRPGTYNLAGTVILKSKVS